MIKIPPASRPAAAAAIGTIKIIMNVDVCQMETNVSQEIRVTVAAMERTPKMGTCAVEKVCPMVGSASSIPIVTYVPMDPATGILLAPQLAATNHVLSMVFVAFQARAATTVAMEHMHLAALFVVALALRTVEHAIRYHLVAGVAVD